MLALLSATAQAFTSWPLRAPAGTRRQADASQVVPLTESVRAAAQLVRAPDSSPQTVRPARFTDVPPVRLKYSSLLATVNGVEYELLRGMQRTLHASDIPDDRGLFLDFASSSHRGDHTVSLGQLHCERFLAASRTKRWWMGPSWGSSAAEVPVETQFVLFELGPDAYALVLPLVRGEFRASLRGKKSSSGRDRLLAQLQSGDPDVRAARVDDALFVAAGTAAGGKTAVGLASRRTAPRSRTHL